MAHPLSKWAIIPVISGLTLLISFITGVITHLLSGMGHQVLFVIFHIAIYQPWPIELDDLPLIFMVMFQLQTFKPEGIGNPKGR